MEGVARSRAERAQTDQLPVSNSIIFRRVSPEGTDIEGDFADGLVAAVDTVAPEEETVVEANSIDEPVVEVFVDFDDSVGGLGELAVAEKAGAGIEVEAHGEGQGGCALEDMKLAPEEGEQADVNEGHALGGSEGGVEGPGVVSETGGQFLIVDGDFFAEGIQQSKSAFG